MTRPVTRPGDNGSRMSPKWKSRFFAGFMVVACFSGLVPGYRTPPPDLVEMVMRLGIGSMWLYLLVLDADRDVG